MVTQVTPRTQVSLRRQVTPRRVNIQVNEQHWYPVKFPEYQHPQAQRRRHEAAKK